MIVLRFPPAHHLCVFSCSLSGYDIVITTYSILGKEIPTHKEEAEVAAEDYVVQVSGMYRLVLGFPEVKNILVDFTDNADVELLWHRALLRKLLIPCSFFSVTVMKHSSRALAHC